MILNKKTLYLMPFFVMVYLFYNLFHVIYDEFKFHLFDIKINEFRKANIEFDKIFVSPRHCKCRSQKISFVSKNQNFEVHLNEKKKSKIFYEVSGEIINSLKYANCDLYNVLRRGPHQKVISYSLYGKDNLYYRYLENIARLSSKYFPGWTLRIHHDNSINNSIICELECLKSENGGYLDNVDFCNIEEIPYGASANLWNASYMHAMSWRWLPIGDPFVDFFMSRDIDSCPSQRELDSVNIWMNSNTIFHIMRDHPGHGTEILGGLWGYANKRNRDLGTHLFSLITTNTLALKYNAKNRKGYDQFFLRDFIFKYAIKNATIHDSYFCEKFGGNPFPTQRPLDMSNLGSVGCFNKSEIIEECPIKCRPKEHLDWIYC